MKNKNSDIKKKKWKKSEKYNNCINYFPSFPESNDFFVVVLFCFTVEPFKKSNFMYTS